MGERTGSHAAPLLLALSLGFIAYINSFRGPFIFDDIDALQNNPRINHSLNGLAAAPPTTLSGRPVLAWSFDLDALLAEALPGGVRICVFHATNLLIHLAAGAALFGIVRRNLSARACWGNQFERSASWLAGVVAAIWLVHPVNTEAVTYMIQRAESLAGLFYLLAIYCLIRGWRVGAVAACALGMGTKEMVVTAPLLALLYDRTFLAGSFARSLKSRPIFYACLAATWCIPLAAVLSGARAESVGDLSSIDYFRTQLDVVAHYISLFLWPAKLVLDYYDWPVVRSWSDVGWTGWLIVLLAVISLSAVWWKPWAGFLGTWFFLVLAPSSSIVPIFTEIAAEHRMYLAMISPIVLLVVGGWWIVRRSKLAASGGAAIAGAVVAALITRTILRNMEYRDPVLLWTGAVAARPDNPRARFNLGYSLLSTGKAGLAAEQFRAALRLEPDYFAAARELSRAEDTQKVQGGRALRNGRGD